LIYRTETDEAAMTPEEQKAWMGEYFAYTNAMREAGVMCAGEALHPTATATAVRVCEGKTVTTRGPFAETKEQLGGYYVVNCPSLDDAIAWAAKCPGARVGSIEVRPLVDFGNAA
jgi:hypothetical protein